MREVIKAFEQEGHSVVKFIAGGETLSQTSGAIQFKKRPWKKFIPKWLWLTLKDINLLRFDGYLQSELEAVILREKPDLVYERGYYLSTAGVSVSAKTGVPHFLEMNAPYPQERVEMEGWSLLNWLGNSSERKQAVLATRVVVVSSAMTNYLVERTGVDKKKIIMTPNAVNPDQFEVNTQVVSDKRSALNINEDETVIGFVGSIFPYHGVDLLIQGFSEVKKKWQEKKMKLLIVGDGETRPMLEQLAIELGISDQVVFTGNVPHKEVATYLSMMDITVMARSNWYGSPVKIFEYGLLGKFIIAPNTVPVLDVMENGIDGLIINDNLVALSEALSFAVEKPVEAKAMASHFKDKVIHNYTWRHIGRQILKEVEA
jgi:glycosyltransferase involved in cell wall biosynthesis